MDSKQITALRKKVERLEADNQHNDVAIAVTKAFGTKDEVASLLQIKTQHIMRGYIESYEITERTKISSKYYRQLFKTN